MFKNDEETQLLRIFPLLIWHLVFVNIKDATDYHKICDASMYFRAWFREKATQILFSKAAKILLKSYLPSSACFLLRQMCRAWRKAVDRQKQMMEPIVCQSNGKIPLCFMPFFKNYMEHLEYRFGSPLWLSHFEEHFHNSHWIYPTNPFLSRKVAFHFDDTNCTPEHYNAFLQFLHKYGQNISYCDFNIWISDPAALTEFYGKKLISILSQTPNIRGMYILAMATENILNEVDKLLNMEKLLLKLPTLPKLEHVVWLKTPFKFYKGLIVSNAQIRYTNVPVDSSAEYLQASLEMLPNLSAVTPYIASKEDVEVFSRVRLTNKLEKLWVQWYERTCWNTIFQILQNQFADSLTELHIRLPPRQKKEMVTELNLLHLKVLHLNVGSSATPLDFLLPMNNSLKELSVRYETTTLAKNKRYRSFNRARSLEHENKSKVKLYMYWDDLQNSNIWMLFSKLKLLRTSISATPTGSWNSIECTREEWSATL